MLNVLSLLLVLVSGKVLFSTLSHLKLPCCAMFIYIYVPGHWLLLNEAEICHKGCSPERVFDFAPVNLGNTPGADRFRRIGRLQADFDRCWHVVVDLQNKIVGCKSCGIAT